jgi:hypothetical protein
MIRLNEKCQKFIPLAIGISLLCQKAMLLPCEALILTTVLRREGQPELTLHQYASKRLNPPFYV